MVKITFCDKCKQEIEREDERGDINGIPKDLFKDDEWWSNIWCNPKVAKIRTFTLCDKCRKGYNKIVNLANKNIIEYVQEDK